MENKQSPSKKLISIQEEKLIREVNYDSLAGNESQLPKKDLLLDLEIFRKHPTQRPVTQRQASQRVLVSIKPRHAAPAIKTIYIAEKSRFYSRKSSEKSGSRSLLGIGDHSSYSSTLHTEEVSNEVVSIACDSENNLTTSSATESDQITTTTDFEQSTNVSGDECSSAEVAPRGSRRVTNIYKTKKRSAEKCYVYTQPQFTMNLPKGEIKTEKSKGEQSKVDIGTLIITNSSDGSTVPNSKSFNNTIQKLSRKIDHLERKILRQEMVFRSIDPNIPLSSSDEECQDSNMKSASESGRACCSYIQQYSHIPETSAFQRYAQQTSSLSPSKATTLEKEHNSEQYGRDFTTYDGITARGRRHSASVPCKRDDFPKMAADRVHKIRHKLNPVRDYRLMDTVHYLAQGEFAPRDDGIKLTPSREAVLSDIIWEDVCRTHWPNTRLGRRGGQQPQPERCGTRCELQRLIDSLLRERVAHVERRRRRHYRIVKLNHRHENCRPVGKTGDIIVASHKNKDSNEDREVPISDHNAASAMMSDRRWQERPRKGHKSHDRLQYQDTRRSRRFREDDCSPGPSYVVARGPGGTREPTCCYHSTSPTKLDRNMDKTNPKNVTRQRPRGVEITSGSSVISKISKNPRLVVKKSGSRNKKLKEEPNLEQYILLPTLVIRTPSNVKRQKKFNELYHRILNVEINRAQECAVESEAAEPDPNRAKVTKKDIGFNINITLSSSAEILTSN